MSKAEIALHSVLKTAKSVFFLKYLLLNFQMFEFSRQKQ